MNLKRMKLLSADTGLYLNAAGLDVSEFTIETDSRRLNIGNVCELSAGLEIIKAMNPHSRPELFFWTRDGDGTNRGTAEVDYKIIGRNTPVFRRAMKADFLSAVFLRISLQ